MLLLVTGFIVTGYGNVSRIDPGFDTNNLDMFSLDPVRDGYSAREAETLFARLPEQLSRARGVRAVALAGARRSAACWSTPNMPVSRPCPVMATAARFGARATANESGRTTSPPWVCPW
jgi:hypothetical protein